MIPRIAKAGRSFKGAAQYYLHDKKARTSNRVAFIDVQNLPDGCVANPARAVADMVDVFTHANELKQSAGLKAGRKLQAPVYSYSLAWHPSEQPTQADMIDAARATLKTLGLDDRQALIVGHNDTDHPHVHVIVNRVCPTTGRAAVMSNDQLKLQEWALKYERSRGQNLCPQRAKNAQDRQAGQWRKADNENRPTAYQWRKAESDRLWREYRAARDKARDDRKPMIDALWQQRKNRIEHRRQEVKRSFKPLWRDLFKDQRRKLAHFDNNVFVRVYYAVKQSERRGIMPTVEALFRGNTRLRDQLLKEQERERVQSGSQHKAVVGDAIREIDKAHQFDRDVLYRSFAEEDRARLDHTRQQADDLWQGYEPKPAPDKAKRQFDQIRDQDRGSDTARPKRKRRSRPRRRDGGRSLDMD